MFTGLVNGLGEIRAMQRLGRETRFLIAPRFEMENLANGESIAINGACLSVETHGGGVFGVYASAETMQRTNLGGLRPGALANLERALVAGERLGGHLVSGHVDCVATVERVVQAGESSCVRAGFPAGFSGQVIPKGSVALDGVSLTVNACGAGYLEVNVIPDSLKRTNISQWSQGTKLNMETDMIGKYVFSALRHWRGDGGNSGITMELLARGGFV